MKAINKDRLRLAKNGGSIAGWFDEKRPKELESQCWDWELRRTLFHRTSFLDSLAFNAVGYHISEVTKAEFTSYAASVPGSSSIPFYGASCSSSFYAILVCYPF